MIFSPSFEANPSATSIPRDPISLVIAITVTIASYLLRIQDLGLDRLEHSFGGVPWLIGPKGRSK